MGKEEVKNNLVATKLGLVEKYTRRLKVCKSRPEQKMLRNRIDKYRHQAADASRM
jgi:hypothetical protein